MRRRRSLVSADDATGDLWPSFTDLVSTTALILFVLVLLAYVQNLISGKRLDAYQVQISTSERKLRFLEEQLRRTSAEIELGQTQLKLSELKLQEQKDVIAESNRELGNLRARLEGIAVLRLQVLEKVRASIEAELGPKLKTQGPLVSIGDNGNIVINESLVFEYNSYAIKPSATALLNTLAKGLGNLLSDPSVRENVDTIVIQGHTDERGSAGFNRELSAKRANAVLNYLFEANPVLESAYGGYFASSAYSEFRPLSADKTELAHEQNRRIEVSVVLKDANVRRVIDDYIETAPPPAAPPPAP